MATHPTPSALATTNIATSPRRREGARFHLPHFPRPRLPRLAASALLCAALAGPALAGPRSVTFLDPAGDAGPVGDATSATLSWDSANGHWTALWQADPAHPFTGNARFNLNLFDTTLTPFTSSSYPQLTLDGFMNFGAGSATTFSYAGTDALLMGWQIGDVLSTGNGSSFYSGVMDQASAGRDILLTRAVVTGSDATRQLPEPGTLALLGAGLAITIRLGRRRQPAGARTSLW